MGKYLKKFENHSAYEAAQSSLILPNVSLCVQEDEVHYNPFVDPCTSEIVQTTYEWVEIGGIKWATKNVGALTVTDYGQYFSWGGINGYTADQVSGSCRAFSWTDYELGDGGSSAANMIKYNSTDGKTILDAVDDAATVNMGAGWRMPTTAEFQALGAAVNTAWTQVNNVYGILCTDKTDSSKTLFFPAVGICSNGSVNSVGYEGCYWSSSLHTSYLQYAKALYFNNSRRLSWDSMFYRNYGLAVRGVVDE